MWKFGKTDEQIARDTENQSKWFLIIFFSVIVFGLAAIVFVTGSHKEGITILGLYAFVLWSILRKR
ncbi:MAG: hypothetical protein Q7K21_04555 [Elusimicrobiota bacterium]|nr:hypothetical protein [Elusimicrobiota bacterium]